MTERVYWPRQVHIRALSPFVSSTPTTLVIRNGRCQGSLLVKQCQSHLGRLMKIVGADIVQRDLPHMLSHPSTRHGKAGIRLVRDSIRLAGLGDSWFEPILSMRELFHSSENTSHHQSKLVFKLTLTCAQSHKHSTVESSDQNCGHPSIDDRIRTFSPINFLVN